MPIDENGSCEHVDRHPRTRERACADCIEEIRTENARLRTLLARARDGLRGAQGFEKEIHDFRLVRDGEKDDLPFNTCDYGFMEQSMEERAALLAEIEKEIKS